MNKRIFKDFWIVDLILGPRGYLLLHDTRYLIPFKIYVMGPRGCWLLHSKWETDLFHLLRSSIYSLPPSFLLYFIDLQWAFFNWWDSQLTGVKDDAITVKDGAIIAKDDAIMWWVIHLMSHPLGESSDDHFKLKRSHPLNQNLCSVLLTSPAN